MQVKSITECSKRSILQYFCPSVRYQLSLRSLFCLFSCGRFTQVLLYLHLDVPYGKKVSKYKWNHFLLELNEPLSMRYHSNCFRENLGTLLTGSIKGNILKTYSWQRSVCTSINVPFILFSYFYSPFLWTTLSLTINTCSINQSFSF